MKIFEPAFYTSIEEMNLDKIDAKDSVSSQELHGTGVFGYIGNTAYSAKLVIDGDNQWWAAGIKIEE